MRQHGLWVCLLLLFTAVAASAEEFALKDGTKIQGRMVAIKGDVIQVETSYGKIKLSRADIVTINFAQSAVHASAPSEAKPALPTVDHSLQGTSYTNRTGNFRLTLPAGWKIDDDVRSQDSIGGLSDALDLHYLNVVQETFPGSLKAYKGLMELGFKNDMPNYEHLSETPLTINGREGVFIFYKGNPTNVNFPLKWLIAIVRHNGRVTRITTWCADPLFDEAQKVFEKIILSYEALP